MGQDEIRELEHRVAHARAVAAVSIGQHDRAENVRHREELEAKLREARQVQQDIERIDELRTR